MWALAWRPGPAVKMTHCALPPTRCYRSAPVKPWEGTGQGHEDGAHRNEVIDGEAARWQEAAAFGGGEGASVVASEV
jgi:hypothetical protein